MYQGCMHMNDNIATWKEAATSSNIQPFVLMELALIYWLNQEKHTYLRDELKQFTQLLIAICSIASPFLIFFCIIHMILWFRNMIFIVHRY